MAGFMASPSVSVCLTFDPLSLIGFRSLLVLIFAFQAAVRGSPDSESGFVTSQVVDQVDQANGRRVAPSAHILAEIVAGVEHVTGEQG
jgi:hypothetical protein